ncbi:hypothetical protein BMW24_003360 [Mycobacterium heckeshornense]|uniref:hypothetical protein n=1 Tax=Mycobacterium heckeshornense TaxID=110505 RepID=UPI0008FD6ADB|nr:hypothetical protein [Mycobacterium heckeshornense]PIJ36718.1 hypothetical protein BMW24_003075 [Mycobacterium heckeshornense]PIJ36769.1 hypothetical protein BMW24_003360 [Mycobacterium heckeshornense]
MAVDSNGRWIGFGVGDVDDPNLPRSAPNWHAIELLTSKLHDKYAWARARGIVAQPRYDEQVAGAVEEFCNRAGLAVIRDRQGFAVATLAVRTRLGSFPPPAPTLSISQWAFHLGRRRRRAAGSRLRYRDRDRRCGGR